MSDEVFKKYQQYILDTIDHLRHRKARPDSERIYHSLTKKYALSYNDAKISLERAVQNGSVLRVEYKGNISYRNAARKNMKRDGQGDGLLGNKTCRKFTGLVTNAIAELVLQEPDYLQFGVPATVLVNNILSKDSVKYTRKYVLILLDKEVEIGGLVKMENGNFLVGPTKTDMHTTLKKPREMEDTNVQAADLDSVKLKRKPGPKLVQKLSKPENMFDDARNDSLRVGGRRKKAKKVFDPSDTTVPRKRGRPAGSLNKSTIEKQLAKMSDSDSRPESRCSLNGREQGGVCSVCHLQNKKGPNDRMIACRECSNKAHYSCLINGDMMLRMYPDHTWQCPHCKTCTACYETSDAGFLAVCSICADAYHLGCHQPRLTERVKNETNWICTNCTSAEQLAVKDIQSEYGTNRIEPAPVPREDLIEDTNGSDRSMSSESSFRSNLRSSNSSPSLPTPSPLNSESPPHESSDDEVAYWGKNFDPNIPDARFWTCDDVYRYFCQFIPEEDSRIFKDEEIDGRSLLLLRRCDIMELFKLPLGSKLLIFKYATILQYRRDDPCLYWR